MAISERRTVEIMEEMDAHFSEVFERFMALAATHPMSVEYDAATMQPTAIHANGERFGILDIPTDQPTD